MHKLVSKTLIAAAVATTMVAGSAQAASHAESITVVSWGGAYTTSQVEAYHKPWMAQTGNTIVSEDYNSGLAEIKAQVLAENVTWNLVDVELSDAIRGCDEGILEVMDHSVLPDGDNGVPASEDFLPGALVECAVGNIVWSTVFIHDESKIQGVDGLTDFFDLNKFPGKRGLRKGAKPNLEFALMADGVEPEDVYEMLGTDAGIDRAFAKLDTIKDSTVWWESGAQPPQLLADGEVTMTTAPDNFKRALQNDFEFWADNSAS
jgi:putative spermidine/putrescine transport system substrate-binding protein